jgi:putative tryptophan/tyrosine transport system substrate-binding protein
MKRRNFILAGGAMAVWALVAGAQEPALPVIGVLFGLSDSNPEHQSFFETFIDELTRLGWKNGRTVRIEQRWTNADNKRTSAFAAELVALRPDVILTATTPVAAASHRETSTIPIVFTIVSDPVGAGFVASLRRPGGNMTGFTQTDAALGGSGLACSRRPFRALSARG